MDGYKIVYKTFLYGIEKLFMVVYNRFETALKHGDRI